MEEANSGSLQLNSSHSGQEMSLKASGCSCGGGTDWLFASGQTGCTVCSEYHSPCFGKDLNSLGC